MKLFTDIFRIETNHVAPKKGRILIAEPFLSGSYFNRSVVFLVSHGENGSTGFILNKKIEYPLSEFIIDIPHFKSDVFIGGPVNTDSLYYIHTMGKSIPGSIHICNGIFWGGDFPILQQFINSELIRPDQVLFFLGYSGWEQGQLEEEIEENSWLVSDISPEKVMNSSFQKYMWLDTVRNIGGKYKLWENYPENPMLN